MFYMTSPGLTKELKEIIDCKSTLKETYSTVNTVLAENLA